MPSRAAAALAFAALLAVPFATCANGAGKTYVANSLDNPNVPTGEGDAIFVVYQGGALEPVGVRRHGKFIDPGSSDGGPSDKLRMESNATIAAHGNRVNVIFGGRVVATVPAKVANGDATIAVPPSLHLNDNVNALASPTLGGRAKSARRAPTAGERKAVLAEAAQELGAVPAAKLEVRNLTALDLGHGTAIVGTVNLRGSGSPRKDKRAFFIAEPGTSAPQFTLFNRQTITVSEPLLEEVSERFVDAIDLGDGQLSVVAVEVGYDAHTFAVYSRKGEGWKKVYTGGGAAL